MNRSNVLSKMTNKKIVVGTVSSVAIVLAVTSISVAQSSNNDSSEKSVSTKVEVNSFEPVEVSSEVKTENAPVETNDNSNYVSSSVSSTVNGIEVQREVNVSVPENQTTELKVESHSTGSSNVSGSTSISSSTSVQSSTNVTKSESIRSE